MRYQYDIAKDEDKATTIWRKYNGVMYDGPIDCPFCDSNSRAHLSKTDFDCVGSKCVPSIGEKIQRGAPRYGPPFGAFGQDGVVALEEFVWPCCHLPECEAQIVSEGIADSSISCK